MKVHKTITYEYKNAPIPGDVAAAGDWGVFVFVGDCFVDFHCIGELLSWVVFGVSGSVCVRR